MKDLPLSPEQVRSARALLQWSQAELAQHADVAVSTIADFERGHRIPIQNNVSAIRQALEREGVTFTSGGATLAYGLSLYLMSEENAAELHVHYTADGVPAVQDLLAVFGEVGSGGASVDAVQSATKALKTALDDLVSKHARAVPHLHRLKKFIHALRDDEFFLLLPEPTTSTAEKFERERLLYRLNHPAELAAGGDGAQALFATLLERYDITSPRTDRETVIGNKQRANRKCRFCHRTASMGATFKSAAHAIPTALGNDFLKLADECDDCNNHFGKETEPSLIAMLDIQRAFLGTQGRGKSDGRPELRFSEGKVFHDGQKVNINAKSISRDDATNVISVPLGKGAVIVPVAVYRALVKIALSVVKADQLPHLVKTIEWLREGKHSDLQLPTVAAAVIELPPNPSAQITLYVRKDDAESRLPHIVAEFRLGCYVYVYAIPFSDRDSWDLVGFFNEPEFRDTFRHYAAAQRWSQHDLSGQNKVAMTPQIKFVPRNP
jgi:transcriptional regulator with XRE-family HTH domain/GGDEF domain-containing protein